MLPRLDRAAIAVLATAALSLAACDTTAPGPDDDIQGTWSLVSVSGQSVLTVSESQTVVDLSRPAVGRVQISGEVNGEVLYVEGYARSAESTDLSLSSLAPRTGPHPRGRLSLSILDRNASSEVWLRAESETDLREYAAFLRSPVGDGARMDLDLDLYPAAGGEPAVRVSGAFTLGSRTVPASEPTPVQTEVTDYSLAHSMRYRFAAGGVVGIQAVDGDHTTERLGQWSRTGDRLTIRRLQGVGISSDEFRVERDGDTLRLVVSQDTYTCDAECLSSAEGQFGLAPGTLRSVTPEGVYLLERVSE